MRIKSIFGLILSAALLSACTHADVQGYKNRVGEMRAPKMYAGQNSSNLLKPADVGGWHYVSDYDSEPNALSLQPQDTGESVIVDPESSPEYTDLQPVEPQLDVAVNDYGRMVQQLFFAHGSSRIGKADRKSISKIVLDFKAAGSKTPALTLVGRASARVDGVTDPLQRRQINLEMSNKRAVAVANAFKKAGAAPTWIETVSVGDQDAVLGATPEQEAKDRRVDIYVNDKMSGKQ
jgi:outer membrane protein OmpA-like peptidoglycan-associated protein